MKDKLSNGSATTTVTEECCYATAADLDVDIKKPVVTNGFGHSKLRLKGGKSSHNDASVHRRLTHNHNDGSNHHGAGPMVPDASDEADTGEGAQAEVDVHVPTRIQVLRDPANICTFAGAVLAMLALASMWRGRYYLGMCLNVAASIADIVDGPIARSTPNRHPIFSVVGSKLDCYSDIVSHFVVPASLLMHLGDMSPPVVVLAAIYVCAGILRQSYFEVTGRCDEGRCIFGVTSDYMVAIYSVLMHFLPLVGHQSMLYLLVLSVVVMIFCSLTFNLRSRRYDGFGLFTVTAYNVLLCASCLGLAMADTASVSTVALITLPAVLLLAYPCYFRFVEINR